MQRYRRAPGWRVFVNTQGAEGRAGGEARGRAGGAQESFTLRGMLAARRRPPLVIARARYITAGPPSLGTFAVVLQAATLVPTSSPNLESLITMAAKLFVLVACIALVSTAP